jgi:methionyl-tRNA synthetase
MVRVLIYHVCADDAHGTPIMLKANELGITPEALIKGVSERHQADFKDFFIGFSQYHSTHSHENKTISADIYNQLNAAGYIIVANQRNNVQNLW